MAINWETLQNTIDSFLRQGAVTGNTERTPEDTAGFIATSYYNEIMSNAVELFGNKVLSINISPLKQSLTNAFKSDFNLKNGGANNTNSVGILGIIDVWNGGKMQTIIPPPPGMIPVSNDVTSPGTVNSMNVNNSTNNTNVPLSVEIIKCLKAHTKTISGINAWLFIPSTGTPIPIPGAWTGIS